MWTSSVGSCATESISRSPTTALRPSPTRPGPGRPPRSSTADRTREAHALRGDDGNPCPAPVDVHHGSVHEGRFVTGQPDHGMRDGVRRADVTGRGALHHDLARMGLTAFRG